MDKLLVKAKKQLAKKMPFVLYAKPGKMQLKGIFQQDDQVYTVNDFIEKGFVFVSSEGEKRLFIPIEKSVVKKAQMVFEPQEIVESDSFESTEDGERFKILVQKAKDSIAKGDFIKVVLSRKEIIDLDAFDLADVLKRILEFYPNAFRYCWFHPETGLWLGATPEQLLKVSGRDFRTVSLAGTQPFQEGKEPVWTNKEIEEQELVTDYIGESFIAMDIPLALTPPYSFRAGNLMHLKTDITGSLAGFDLASVLSNLHPTPAVCGFPKSTAQAFIESNEGYDREYYSGYLGELNKETRTGNQHSDLFVNLRCMKIEENQAHIFVGCGITAASDPEKEFIETVNKAMTMRKVLPLNNTK